MQARFTLKPLPRKPRSRRRPGRDAHPAERQVGRRPDLGAGAVRRKHRPPDVVGADEADHPAFNHSNRRALQPDILPDQRPRRLVVLRDPVAIRAVDRMYRDPLLRQPPDDLLAQLVVDIFG